MEENLILKFNLCKMESSYFIITNNHDRILYVGKGREILNCAPFCILLGKIQSWNVLNGVNIISLGR